MIYMRISELPIKIKRKVIKYIKKQNIYLMITGDELNNIISSYQLSEILSFADTIEGYDYWSFINNGLYNCPIKCNTSVK